MEERGGRGGRDEEIEEERRGEGVKRGSITFLPPHLMFIFTTPPF